MIFRLMTQRLKSILVILLIFVTCITQAQTTTFQIQVRSHNETLLEKVAVSVNDNEAVLTDADGKATTTLALANAIPTKVTAIKQKWKIEDWVFDLTKKEIQILMWPAPILVEGLVLDQFRNAFAYASVRMEHTDFITQTNKQGYFTLEVPVDDRIGPNTRFLVNDSIVTQQAFVYDRLINFLTITINRNSIVAQTEESANDSTLVSSSSSLAGGPAAQQTIAAPVQNTVVAQELLIVVVYENNLSPASGVRVVVDSATYTTDENGEFNIKTSSISNINFVIDKYYSCR